MRASLSKRAKSPNASPSATPKLSRKQPRSMPAKAVSNQKLKGTVTVQKVAVKPLTRKAAVVPVPGKKVQKKAVPAENKKKNSAAKLKPASSQPARATTSRKLSPKAKPESSPTVQPSKLAKPKVIAKSKVIATPKVKVTPPRISRVVPKVVAPPPKIPRQQTTGQALRAFERAVKAFNLRQFSEAKALFEELQQRYHQEVEIIARSQTYIQVCNVRLAANRSLPRNADEFYDRGVVALNVGNFAQARTFFEKALKLRPDDSHTLYSLAATHAQAGATDKALTYLQQAVQRQPRLRQQAIQDTDFSTLKDDRRFLELLGATSPFDLLDSRRDLS